MAQKKSIVFFHPDLGIGGAERLVIDAAVGLQARGHKVTIFTSHCDPGHCFEEARDGTLDVRVRGNSLVPPTIFGRFAILCAILRQLHLVCIVALWNYELDHLRPTHFFVDQLSAAVPLLRFLYTDVGILFYCHFPDQLLAQKGEGAIAILKKAYRIPFNAIESWSTASSHGIVVNSKFTGGMVKRVLSKLSRRDLKVVYPCVDISTASQLQRKAMWSGRKVILSINRFEKKKDVALAVKAFAKLDSSIRKSALLVIAGGYDSRVPENVNTHRELEQLADSLKLSHETHKSLPDPSVVSDKTSVLFLLSVPDVLKQTLLASAELLVYTPQNEHFGIVPLEAMLAQVPVLAANEGGPLETVVEGETGWLRDIRKPDEWTAVMSRVLSPSNPAELRSMGENGRKRVQAEFSKEQMALRLDQSLDEVSNPHTKPQKPPMIPGWLWMVVIVSGVAVSLALLSTWLLFFLLENKTMLSSVRAHSAGRTITEEIISTTTQVVRNEL
ncbi:mannosyltransferase [Aureobasidium subglaciale]|uniref:Alpha-1,3/1,6-mannosyltransferase ALG2 n=1 Tax=Aureobasidium subglaciale (strain EXF-2481) TaxID=1043005 RepID=A0A074YFR2_AURSE|nr:glycosyltransferase family 4 protein [Aureobasidium subglaciale EXF-2481]KAI5201034.1 mannosyltransferase [Aureobasidium subglaciale]KAI5219700.1 mannosyltransferase [Aureobasidium subglaciale]KAI5223430.1 mannosyltransferase [Aureobasidium subglaciale]KAI5246747.1 mannosyltransferase [Aureobasidium subglaciale]KAI5260391.1 mannosyltransferase [Aureobasidium subglaciale]